MNELIPDEEKDRFSFPVSTGTDGSKPTLWKWTIDRDRDAKLVLADVEGGAYEGTQKSEHYVLIWRGTNIHFIGEPHVPSGVVTPPISWRIRDLIIPGHMQDQAEEVKGLIAEALDAKGLLYRRDRVTDVQVVFLAGASGQK